MILSTLIGLGGLALWSLTRPVPTVLEAPTLTPALREALLAALSPGWPARKPTLKGSLGEIPVVAGRIDGIAAADADGDGQPEWGVAYAWLGADGHGGRAVKPGFAVLAGGDEPALIYQGPGAGGWNGPADDCYADVAESGGGVEAVSLGKAGVGFLQRTSLEMAVGGRLSQGQARLFAPHLGEWGLAWEGETEQRWRAGPAEETARTVEVRLEDLDGDGQVEIVTQPSWYVRRMRAAGQGAHYSAGGLGELVYRPSSGRYFLSRLLPGGGQALAVRAAAPLLAMRAREPVVVDGRFDDWEAEELLALSALRLADPARLKYQRRPRRGIEDFSGDLSVMWDAANMYVRAAVTDDTVRPGPAGRELYQGDHLALWLDWDLAGDFRDDARSADDWQIGLKPAGAGRPAEAYCWVPKTGQRGIKLASRPLVDGYNGAVLGYELEAAIPWASLGGLPPGTHVGALAERPATRPNQARHYRLGVAGALGFGAVLTDADSAPQELVYVSNPDFTWAAPRSFDTLLLVEPRGEK